MRQSAIVAAFVSALAGCDGTGTNPFDPDTTAGTTAAAFQTPNATGVFPTPLANAAGNSARGADGRGYAYQVGVNADSTGIAALSGIIAGTAMPAPPTTGTAVMNGDYRLRTLRDPTVTEGRVSATSTAQNGPIALTADFTAGTLTGTADGLTVAGRFTGGTLSGTVDLNGLDGPLTGLVGPDAAVGAFQASSNVAVMAGGFLVTQ